MLQRHVIVALGSGLIANIGRLRRERWATENLRTSVVAGCNTPPILQPIEHELYPIAPFVAALVVLYRFLPLLPARDAGAHPFVFERLPEPIAIIATIPEQPIDIRQTAQRGPCSDVIADLPSCDEEVERMSLAVADGM